MIVVQASSQRTLRRLFLLQIADHLQRAIKTPFCVLKVEMREFTAGLTANGTGLDTMADGAALHNYSSVYEFSSTVT